MNTTVGVNIWIVALALFFSSCSLLGGKENEPAIPGKLVYSTHAESGGYQIFTNNTDGSGKKQLTHSKNGEAISPTWSNDGTQIAFISTLRSSSAGLSLYLMNADGSNIRPLKERPNSHIVTPGEYPVWSPDDSKIAFDRCVNCELGGINSELFLYDFTKDSIIQLTDNFIRDYAPQWIDNNSLFFMSNRDYLTAVSVDRYHDLYKIDIGDKSIERITTSGKIGGAIWNPNNESYLIRSIEAPYPWYSIQPVTGDTLTGVKLPAEVDESKTILVKWSKDLSLLMLRSIKTSPVTNISFYDVQEDKIYSGIEVEDMMGIDWH